MHSFLWFLHSFHVVLFSHVVFAQVEIHEDTHITSFVTRPEIKAPKWNIKVNDRENVSPGYWFVSPYHELHPFDASGQKWDACQIGAHIYDNDGELVWSGACLFENRNVFDFKANHINGTDYLSLLVPSGPKDDKQGTGVVLDSNYETQDVVVIHKSTNGFNMHDFNLVDDGRHALALTWEAVVGSEEDAMGIGLPPKKSWVFANGFREFDVKTGQELFAWHSLDHIPQNESTFPWPEHTLEAPPGWDYIHMNSADKNEDGDYLISSRYMNCIYKISGKDGHIIWRLGGKKSNFILQDFNFSRQHHARFLASNETHTIISFLDNAAGEMPNDLSSTTPYSRAMYVALSTETRPMTATLLRHFDRPDHRLTRRRGSNQLLPNGNIFVSWSEGGYQSEFMPDGKLVMEAAFSTNRYSTYRAYKYNFTGNPTEPPALKAFAYGASADTITTVSHVSWNGATEVHSWNFYEETQRNGNLTFIGNAPRKGFETLFMYDGYAGFVVAEALDKDGKPLGRSRTEETIVPNDWRAAGFEDQSLPQPEDPQHSQESTNSHGEEDHGSDQSLPQSEESQEGTDSHDDEDDESAVDLTLDGFVTILLVGLGCCSFLLLIVWLIRRRAFISYIKVPEDDIAATRPPKLDQLHSVVVESHDKEALLAKGAREDV